MAGIVDQGVDRAVAVDGRRDHPLQIVRVGKVSLHGDATELIGYLMNRPGERWQTPRTNALVGALNEAMLSA